MAKTQRSETTWQSPSRKISTGRGVGSRSIEGPEGTQYVLKHTSETPDAIRLHIGGEHRALDVAAVDALIADLTDARKSIAPAEPVRRDVNTDDRYGK